MKKSTINLLLTLSVIGLILLSSCGTPKDVVYFQDLKPGSSIDISATPLTLTIKPQDKLMIVVNSRDPQLMALFNLPEVRKQIVSNGGSSLSSTGQDVLGYTVDKNGEIDFPVLGKIYVAGKTRSWQDTGGNCRIYQKRVNARKSRERPGCYSRIFESLRVGAG